MFFIEVGHHSELLSWQEFPAAEPGSRHPPEQITPELPTTAVWCEQQEKPECLIYLNQTKAAAEAASPMAVQSCPSPRTLILGLVLIHPLTLLLSSITLSLTKHCWLLLGFPDTLSTNESCLLQWPAAILHSGGQVVGFIKDRNAPHRPIPRAPVPAVPSSGSELPPPHASTRQGVAGCCHAAAGRSQRSLASG